MKFNSQYQVDIITSSYDIITITEKILLKVLDKPLLELMIERLKIKLAIIT